jgi:hypothetical protein
MIVDPDESGFTITWITAIAVIHISTRPITTYIGGYEGR